MSCIFYIFGAKIQKQSTKRSCVSFPPPSPFLPQHCGYGFSLLMVLYAFQHLLSIFNRRRRQLPVSLPRCCCCGCCCCCCCSPTNNKNDALYCALLLSAPANTPPPPSFNSPPKHATQHTAEATSPPPLVLPPTLDICYGQQAVRICCNLQHFVPCFCGTMMLRPRTAPFTDSAAQIAHLY